QGAFKQMLLGYITGATNEIDNAFDGESFDGNEFVDFYSVNQDKNLVIQGRALPFDEKDEVALGFRTTINGAFTIKMDQVDGLFTNQNVFIEDKLNNTVFDLKSGDYTFSTVAGIFNDRFVLRYTNKTLGTNEYDFLENQVLVSNKNKQIKITSLVELMDKVLVYDLLGRPLYQKDKVNNTELSLPNLGSNQTLLLKITLQNGKTVSKKVSN
ncbi:T9SS sorting signal type C domain-containing protein, partial [Flavobacterium sp.]|uniref:T9SS sorting signal type C domain-containing protein n=1 Tax=Flavobacterium sp. TaxID=239 RepID=UPI00286CD326